jgi:hypothetical protein
MATNFDSTKKSLKELLERAAAGKIQLPDFQRSWVWDDEGIKSLLASVSQSFPVGALMTLTTGGELRFKPRPIEGAPALAAGVEPEELLLDGQQRITSLYQTTLRGAVVQTATAKQKPVRRWYYIDMLKALDPEADREDAIIGVPEDRMVRDIFGRDVRLDLSTPELEYQQLMFPVRRMFDDRDWQFGFDDFWRGRGDDQMRGLYRDFHNAVIRSFDHYQLPVITLDRSTPRQAVCLVFEKVNTGGKKLDAFELLTAIFASDGYELRKDWYGDTKDGVSGRFGRLTRHGVLRELANTDFLQAVSLVHTRDRRNADLKAGRSGKEATAVSCTRGAILNLPLSAYRDHAARIEHGFELAAKFLHLQRIYWFKDVPYKSQIVPLATILAELGDLWDRDAVRRKIARWYWCGVFGELYGSAIESRIAKDIVEVPRWLAGGEEPTTIKDAIFRAERLDTMRTRLSAAYKGVHALLMKEGARDFRSGQPFSHTVYWDEKVDIHHIFPKAWCEAKRIARRRYDTIVNKTPLTAKTNRTVGSNAPAVYLGRLERGSTTPPALDEHLASHAIDPALLRANDFDAFYDARRDALIRLVEGAMGKAVFREQALDEPEVDLHEVAELLMPEAAE